MSSRNIMDQVRRSLDRVGFEADRTMRYNRVRAEAARLRQQARDRTLALGERALELHRVGNLNLLDLDPIAREVGDLEKRAAQKDREAEAIQKEEWPDPEADATAGGRDPQIGATTGPAATPRPSATGGDPQIGASTGPAPHPVTHIPHSAPTGPSAGASTMHCAACGIALRPQATFCPRCGLKQG
jgi:hypothetical protein